MCNNRSIQDTFLENITIKLFQRVVQEIGETVKAGARYINYNLHFLCFVREYNNVMCAVR